jgi:hypothetical protein
MFACLNGPSLAVGGAVVLELSADYCIALRNDGGRPCTLGAIEVQGVALLSAN